MHTPNRNFWLLAALLGHSAWGVYPVLARYLQIDANLPGLTLLIVANGTAMLVMMAVVWWRGELGQLWIRAGWSVAFFAAARAITNVLAARYAPAAQVTLIGLLTPPLVAITTYRISACRFMFWCNRYVEWRHPAGRFLANRQHK